MKITDLTPLADADVQGDETVPVVKGNKTYRASIGALGNAAADRAELAAQTIVAASNYRPTRAQGEADFAVGEVFSTGDGSGSLIIYERTAAGSSEITRTVTPATLANYARTDGNASFLTNGGRVGISDSFEPFVREGLLDVRGKGSTAAIGLALQMAWEGSAAAPLANNDTALFQTFHKTIDSCSNRTWGLSAPTYVDIPSTVDDDGEVVGLYAWPVSVTRPGYAHEGKLGSQVALKGAVGFRGTGRGPNARVVSATALQAVVEAEDGTIENATAGQFQSIAAGGVIESNIAVYARAEGGTQGNYAFFGYKGRVFNQDSIRIRNELVQSNASLGVRRDGNSVEFGATDQAGYFSTIGATAASGFPFIAFHAKASDAGDTFDTGGIAGSVITTDLAGALRIARAANPNADGQALTNTAVFGANGDIFLGVHASFEGGVFVPGSDNGRDMGIAGSDRWRDLFIVNSPTVGSDEREKTLREDEGPTEAEKAWARAIRMVCYRRNEAIDAKGPDRARLHWGVLAQQVYQAGLDAGIADPFAYAFLCRDEVTRLEMRPVEVERQKVELVTEDAPRDRRPPNLRENQLIDSRGNAFPRKVTVKRAVFRDEPVLDKITGQPVLVEAGESASILDSAGQKLRSRRRIPLTRKVPVMETVEELREVRVPILDDDGQPEVRWAIRYEPLLVFLLACGARDV